MPSHLFLQPPAGRPIPVHGDPELLREQPEPRHRDVELHVREVIADGPDHRMSCSCGFLSVAFHDVFLAESKGCEVEYAMAISQERRRRMLSSAAGLSVSR